MINPILVTKLYIPPPSPQLVDRTRLVVQLNNTTNRKLTLISAPAGFGKTTLTSHWLHQQVINQPEDEAAQQAVWFSLDDNDNDPLRFMSYLVTALRQVDPSIGQTVLDVLQSTTAGNTAALPKPEFIIAPLINDIVVANIPIVLVLDDYHVINSQAIHTTLAFLLDHQPPQLHLVITTRADPPLPLSRLRARGQITEIRADDLRFSRQEADTFLNKATGIQLSTRHIDALEDRTEGWIAGLQLAAISLQDQSVDNFVTAFTGDDRYIVDYLIEEVFNRQPEHIQDFLLQTSILERLSAPLCDAVTEDLAAQHHNELISGQNCLTYLEQSNLFIIPLDNKRQWYRYHHLFGSLLRHRLEQLQPDLVAELHCRASHWYAQANLIDEAIEHAFASADETYTIHLLEKYTRTLLWDHGSIRTFLKWLNQLPQTVIYQRTTLAIAYCWVLYEFYTDREITIQSLITESQKMLDQKLEADPPDDELKEIKIHQSELLMVLANVVRRQGKALESIDLCQKILARLSSDYNAAEKRMILTGAYLTMAASYDSLGQAVQATALYRKGLILTQAAKSSNSYLTLLNVGKLLDNLTGQGQLTETLHLFEQYQPLIAKTHGCEVGMVYINIGEVFREQNNFEQATKYLRQGIDLCKPFDTMALMVVKGCLSMAWLTLAQGDPESAQILLQEAQQYSNIDKMPYPPVRFEAGQAHLQLALRQQSAAIAWAEQMVEQVPSLVDPPYNFLYEIDYLVLARILIVQQKTTSALELLQWMQQSAQDGGRQGRLIAILILQALAHHASGDTQQPILLISQALQLAQPQSYIRLFVDEGLPMQQLLQATRPQSITVAYIDTLLTHFPDQPNGKVKIVLAPAPVVSKFLLVDPLTKRELKTLKLLATELSIAAIAAEMVVAVSTVRSHAKSIYSKLAAHSRYEAVQRAKELGLLIGK